MANITINSRKIDNSIHRSWKCTLLEETNDYWLFWGKFETELLHEHLGLIRPGTISYEYYWKHKYFNVFRFHEPNGNFKCFYCNINLLPIFENGVLDYIDLDIDVLVDEELSFQILDLEEFEDNTRRFQYSENVRLLTKNSLGQLLKLIQTQGFPFDCKNFQTP